MGGATDEVNVDINHIVTSDDASDGRFFDATESRIDELRWYLATSNLASDRHALTTLVRAHFENDVAILTFTARLLDELALAAGTL